MSDLFGLLSLPAPEPETAREALADPALDMLLDFMRAVLNADLGDAWAARCPTSPDPVTHVFNHEPKQESFNADETPALYAWRADDAGTFRYSQDLVADESGVVVLWVPPPLPQEEDRFLEQVRNGLKKSLKAAFAQGRHPAWVLAGDTYYDPETYGSVLLRHAKLGKARLGAFRQHVLQVASPDGSYRRNFDCLFFQIDTLEFFQRDLSAETPLGSGRGAFSLALSGDRADALEVLAYRLEPTLAGVDVSSGPAAGGTAVVLSGAQLDQGLRDPASPDPAETVLVYLGTPAELAAGTAAPADPDRVSPVEGREETALSFVTPPHAAGAVTVRVVFPSGATKDLAAAFTYTP